MDYSQEYKQKLVSADEAVKLIKSGDWVDFGWCTNTVDALDQALAKRTDELTNVNLRGGVERLVFHAGRGNLRRIACGGGRAERNRRSRIYIVLFHARWKQKNGHFRLSRRELRLSVH